MDWLISANSKVYDHASAFAKCEYVDWRQGNKKYNVGDNIYIYCSKPLQRIMYKTEVIKTHLTKDEVQNDSEFWKNKDEFSSSINGLFCRLKLIEQVNRDELSLIFLMENGLKAPPQGAMRLPAHLKNYIDNFMNDSYFDNVFPESDNTDICIEGAKISVEVNKYERSSVARAKCIAHHGCTCQVCGMDFEDTYGELGKGFIHVHHIKPLHEVREDYIVDPINDLIPVCPNCHSMLHRKMGKELPTIESLQLLFKPHK